MKIALVTDYLLGKDHYHEMVLLFCEIFENAEIYTLAHRPGSTFGRIQERKIFSTFLSNQVESIEDFRNRQFLIPSAAKSLEIPEGTDLVISISHGLGHGVKIPKSAKYFCYLYGWDVFKGTRSSWVQKIFSAMLEKWKLSSLEKEGTYHIATQSLLRKLREAGFTQQAVVQPSSFKFQDYHAPAKTDGFDYDYHMVDITNMKKRDVLELVEFFKKMQIKAKFFGNVESFSEIKSPLVEFLGFQCSGTLNDLFSKSRAVWDFSHTGLPTSALAAMAVGRPFVARESEEHHELIPSGKGVFHKHDLEKSLKEIDSIYKNIVVHEQRLVPVKYTEGKFKVQLKKYFEKNFSLPS